VGKVILRPDTNSIIAHMDEVGNALDHHLFEMQVRAEEIMVSHIDEGHAFITTETGKVDRYLILNDERGKKAALSIEYGTQKTVLAKEPEGEWHPMSPQEYAEQYAVDWSRARSYQGDDGVEYVVISATQGVFALHRAAEMRPRFRGAK
jgi:hypothetical protein